MNNSPEHISSSGSPVRTVLIFFALTAGCALLVGLLLAVFMYRTNATGYYLQLTRERQLFNIAGALRYGVVESAHPEFNAVVVRLVNNFSPGDPPRLVTVQVPPLTRIARQDMQQQNGVYYALGPLLPATIADLTPGSNVALLLDTLQEGSQSITARAILVGNPL